jgi:Rrf2 family protein
MKKRIPRRFLLQIMRRLVTAGVLRSARGAEGGYALNRAAEDVTLLDIVDAVDVTSDVRESFLESFGPETRQRLLEIIDESNEASRQVISRLTLAELSQSR